MSRQDELKEPLLPAATTNLVGNDDHNGEREQCIVQRDSQIVSNDGLVGVEVAVTEPSTSSSSLASVNGNNINGNEDSGDEPSSTTTDAFSIKNELWEMLNLGIPLAVSFFCRMGMASTDSAFVGHIENGAYTAETYLAAAVLSDMCVSIFTTPPLAFNQVLNALVGQAMGSGNPRMAGVWLQQSMFWLTVSMLPCLVGFFYVEDFLTFLGFPAHVASVAGVYAVYNIVWPVPNGLYQCMRFFFQAQGLPRPAMHNNITFLFVNAMLNWIFVFGGPFRYIPRVGWNGFGFVGAAISLSISRTMQSVVYFLYMFVYKQHHKNTWPEAGLSLEHHTWDRTREFLKQSLPNLGTLLFSVISNQATTVLVGRLGELSIAASSALSTVTIPWSGTLGATTTTISSVRVGYHLGRGDGKAAQRSAGLLLYFISIVMVIVAVTFVPLQYWIMNIATDDHQVIDLGLKLVPAMLIGTYLNLLVSNITSGVFSGMGRPIIATILSFGLELPMSVGGVAIYILTFHGSLLGVYWWNAISGAIEVAIVVFLLLISDWDYWAREAQRRQEVRANNSPSTTEENAETISLVGDSAVEQGDAATEAV